MIGQIDYENLNPELAKKIQDSLDMNTKASTDELGLVRIDGTTITIDSEGIIKAVGNDMSGLVKTVNHVSPDLDGNINTAFRLIDIVKMDVNWTDIAYPSGISEFVTNYDPANYTDYIKIHPSYQAIPKGKLSVRTYKDTNSSPAIVWQFMNSTEGDSFYAQFFRMGKADGTWGEVNVDNPSHVIHIKKAMSPSAIITDYPRGVSVFDATYDASNLEWYEALGLMDKDDYKKDVGSYPKGSIAVTSFRNETLINQIIQMTDEHTGTIGTFTRYYDSEITPNKWVGGNSLDSGLDGRVRSVNDKSPKVNGSITLTASDVDTYNKEEIDFKIDGASGNYTLPIATPTTLGGVKVDNSTIKVDGEGVLKSVNIEGLTISPNNINTWLTGTNSNIQTQIDSIKDTVTGIVGGMKYLGTAPTYASIVATYPNAENGDIVVVLKDENHNDTRSLYVYTTSWQSVGDFEMADTFTQLTDTPDSYTGSGNKLVKVKSTADGLEFIDDVSVKSVNNITPDAKGNVNITSDDNVMLADSVLHFSYAKGNDYTGDGTQEKPLQSIENYLNKIRGKKILNDRGIAIIILDMPRAIEFDLTRIDLEMLFISGLFAEPDPQVGKVTVLNGVMPINISSLKMGRLNVTDCNPLVRVVSSTISDGNEPALTATNSKVSCEAVNFYYAPTLVMANMSSNVALMSCFTRESDSIKTGLNAQKGSLIVYDNSASTLAEKGIIKSQGGRVINGSEFPLKFVTKFSELSDVPHDYTGQTGKYVRVNTSANGLEFSDVDTYTKDEIDNKISEAKPVIDDASTTQKGIVQLTNDITGSSQVLALTQKGAKQLTDEIASGAEKLVEHILTKASRTELGHVTVDNTSIKASRQGEISVVNPFTDLYKDRINNTRETAICPPKLYFSYSTGHDGNDGLTSNTPKQSLDAFLLYLSNKELSASDGQQSVELIMLDSNDPSSIILRGMTGVGLTLTGNNVVFSKDIQLVNCQNKINLTKFTTQYIDIADCSHVTMSDIKTVETNVVAIKVVGTNYVSMNSMVFENNPLTGITCENSVAYVHCLPSSMASLYGVVATQSGVVLLSTDYPTGHMADVLENGGKVIKI